MGVSLGGSIADRIGWRWCFLSQAPVSALALVLGVFVLEDQAGGFVVGRRPGLRAIWHKVDVTGSLVLVSAISSQLVGLSLGRNELSWGHWLALGSLVLSVVLLQLFVLVEATTTAIPIIPMRMLRGTRPVLLQIANNFVGLSAYAVRALLQRPLEDIFVSIYSCCHCISK